MSNRMKEKYRVTVVKNAGQSQVMIDLDRMPMTTAEADDFAKALKDAIVRAKYFNAKAVLYPEQKGGARGNTVQD